MKIKEKPSTFDLLIKKWLNILFFWGGGFFEDLLKYWRMVEKVDTILW